MLCRTLRTVNAAMEIVMVHDTPPSPIAHLPKCSPFSGANFKTRVLSALTLLPFALWAMIEGGWLYWTALLAIVFVGLKEWLSLVAPQSRISIQIFALLSLFILMIVGEVMSVALASMVGLIFMLILFFLAARDHTERALWITLGLPYMGGFGLSLLWIRNMPDYGLAMLCYLVFAIWATDIGAYMIGKAVGGPKLAPAISPNKTWSGFLGGMISASLMGYAVAWYFGLNTPLYLAGLALILAPVAQFGDLFESHIKRRSGVKESGDLIPGHGGVLDRIDGLIFAAIFFVGFCLATDSSKLWSLTP